MKLGLPGSMLEALAHEIAPPLAAAIGIPSCVREGEAIEEDCEEPVTFPRVTWRCSSLRIGRLEKLSGRVGVQVEEKTGHMWMVGVANPNLVLAAFTVVDEVLRTSCGVPTSVTAEQWKEMEAIADAMFL
eukprot:TRINITY_DN156_c0_g1_i1.p1 TRINITY_DN156_c0_g1~~TRINITY_DN156_c0_g1_i1.p1  ORF type:complete len:130 (-),score=20.63 TRINITY_DN156_c0_g1_i1:364-753(-)